MKRFKARQTYLVFMLILSVFIIILPGCGGGGGGHWDEPVTTTAPTVSSTVPVNGATGVPIGNKLTVTFSEAMDPLTITTATFTLKQGATAVSGTVTYSGVTAVFTPASNLAANTLFTATITTGAKNLAGNALASNYVWSFTTGTATDTTAPTVTGTINANGATGVPINTKVGATFSEGMDPFTITTTTFTFKQGTTAVSGTVTYSGVSAVFTPASNLAANTTYTATITTGAKDLAGNALVSNYVWSWTTGAAADTTAPTVTGTINANGATGVLINTKVGATFSEGMDPLTITNLNFKLKETVSGTAVAGTVSYSGVSALFIPASNLANSTRYTVTVKGGVGGVTDLAGNPMASDFVISWTTGAAPDTTAPTVTGTINANGATGVPINTKVGATFSEAMDPLTITNLNFMLKETVSGTAVAGTLSYSGVSAVFIPLSNLAPSTRYTVTVKGGVGGATDLAGNAMASDYVWSWTTGAALDTTAPTVIATIYGNGATGVPINTRVVAIFSEAMDPLTITTTTFTLQASGPPLGPILVGTVAYDLLTSTATFTPTANLAASTQYTATITTGAKDLAGNALVVPAVGGLPKPNPWTFTTAAEVVPPPAPLVNLGLAAPFGTFGGSAGMTNQGTLTVINGDIGTIATGASSVTGFHDTEGDIYTETLSNIGAVNGTIYTCTHSTTGPNFAGVNAAYCALATQARLDAQTAYLALAAMPVDRPDPGGNLAGLTLAPGVYTTAAGSFLIQDGLPGPAGNLTLDAGGDANAVFVFKMASTLTVGGPGAAFPRSIILAGNAQAKNVFWQVGSFATINAAGGGTMVGTIIPQAGASFSTAGNTTIVTLNGRVLSLDASATMVNTVITVPSP